MQLAKILVFTVSVIFGTGVFAGLSREVTPSSCTEIQEQQEDPGYISAFSVLLY